MLAKEESLLETINKLKSDIDKGKEKSSQQKTQIRDLQQVIKKSDAFFFDGMWNNLRCHVKDIMTPS